MAVAPNNPEREVGVSVIMPVRDSAKTLARALQALREQVTSCTWELIVVDDGSTDDSRRIAEAFTASMPEGRTLDNTRSPGAGGARNTGIRLARGHVVAFCDSDDVVSPGWVQAAYEVARDGGAFSGLCRELTEPLDEQARVINPTGVFHNAYGAAFRTCNAAVNAQLLRAVGGFDESLGRYGHEDSELCVRLTKAGEPIRAASSMVIHYYETQSRRMQFVKVWNLANAEYVYWARHPDRFSEMLNLDVHKRQVTGLIPYYLLLAIRREPIRPTAAGRDAVTRVGRLRAARRWTRAGGVPPARLLEQPAGRF